MNKVAIDIVDLSKIYHLGSINGGTLSQELSGLYARLSHKQNPNQIIGSEATEQNQKLLALDQINLQIQEGDTVGIIGSNGSGKSTLLKILSRITAPTSGKIRIKGRITSLLEVGTGFHSELTGRENTYLNGTILGMSKKEVDSKLKDIIEFAEMERFIDTPVKRYSTGMYVKLAFSVAAHLEPDILIIDEVLAVGDYQFQQKCLNKMSDIAKSGRTILLVSHQLSMIRELCSKCILLDNGRLISYGSTEEVLEEYLEQKVNKNMMSHVEFEEDSGMEAAQICKIRLLNRANTESNCFEIFEPIKLEAEYMIKMPLAGVALGFSLTKNQGTVCQSFDTDYNRGLLNRREPGRYLATVELPVCLKAGNYLLDFIISRPGLDHIEIKKNVLAFTIEEKTIDTGICSYSSGREGQFAFKQQWNHTLLPRKEVQ